ncbi:MAG: hypothetical protein IMF01_06120, partial [Proteobacteria bacterium]|nr:hypothetical protein [Pseudomonadota bacterium]
MKKLNLWIIHHPKAVLALVIATTVIAIMQLPKLRAETNLESMFPDDHPVITYNDLAEEWFEVKDAIVIGVFNKGTHGIYNRASLSLIKEITDALKDMEGILNRKKSDIISLSSLDNIVGTELGMDVTPFMK